MKSSIGGPEFDEIVLGNILETLLERAKLPVEFARLLARDAGSRIRKDCGGSELYVPVEDGQRETRNDKMRREFDGRRQSHSLLNNLKQVARDNDVSVSTARRVCCG